MFCSQEACGISSIFNPSFRHNTIVTFYRISIDYGKCSLNPGTADMMPSGWNAGSARGFACISLVM